MDNPYQSPLTDAVAVPVDEPLREYGGIGRLAYVGYSFLAFIVFSVLFRVVAESGMGATGLGRIILVTRIMLIAWIGSMIFITVQRLKNIGNSGWWSVLLFVPLANIFLGLRCLVCPAGYADNKRLDRAGKIMTGFLLTAFLSAAWTVASMYLNG